MRSRLKDLIERVLLRKEKLKCIIDTDPGVDDAVAIALSLYDDYMEIPLITTVSGNRDIDTVTNNCIYVLEKFKRQDIPVAKGATKPLVRPRKDASFIHQKSGLGGVNPPDVLETKPIKEDAVEAMYKVVCANKGNVVIIGLAPHTNIASLILKHPDVKDMITHIYTEGCSPYGWKEEGPKWFEYASFNASNDPEAVKVVLESGIPLTYIPSRVGREMAHFTEKEVAKMRDINSAGKFIAKMYSGYWEYGYPDRRVATNDTCAVLAMRNPDLFKFKRVQMTIDTDEHPGRTYMKKDRHGNVELARSINRRKLNKFFFGGIKKLDKLNVDCD